MAKDKGKKKGGGGASDEFGQLGSGGDLFKNKDHLGKLLLIRVLSVERGVKTDAGESDAIKANVIVLTKADGKTPLKEPLEFNGTLLFGKVIFSQLSTADTSKWILATLEQGEAKPGKSAPWELEAGNEKQAAIASEYLASVRPFEVSSKDKGKSKSEDEPKGKKSKKAEPEKGGKSKDKPAKKGKGKKG